MPTYGTATFAHRIMKHPMRIVVRVIKTYKGSHPFVQFLGHYCLLSIVSILSPIFRIIPELMAPYIQLDYLTASPALAQYELQRVADYMVLHPAELNALRMGLIVALLAHLVYMWIAWKGLLWLLKRSTRHIHPDPKPFVFEPW
jgi:hypothetical protein